MKRRCSTAWAIPGISSASLKLPTLTLTAAPALSGAVDLLPERSMVAENKEKESRLDFLGPGFPC